VPVQHPAGALLLGTGLQVRKVIAALRLGIGEGHDGVARDDLGDQRVGLRPAHRLQRAARDDDGRKIGLDRDDLAQLLHDDRIFQRAAAQAAMLLGKGRAEHAEILRKRGPDRRVAARVTGDELLARFEAIRVSQKT